MLTRLQKEARPALLVFLLLMTATGALASGFTTEDDDDDMTTALVQCSMVVKLKSPVSVKPSGASQANSQALQTAPTDPKAVTPDTLPQPTVPPQFVVPLRR
jgi:type IV secretory pathway VirB10-like protein